MKCSEGQGGQDGCPSCLSGPSCRKIAAMRRALPIALAVALAAAIVIPRAQMRVAPVDVLQGHVALGLALRHLANVGIVMEATAHPDDEDNGLLVMLNRGQGFRTALVTAPRGNGGQNRPEGRR